MKKYSISPLFIMFLSAFILIDGTMFSVIGGTFAILHETAHIIALKLSGKKTLGLFAKSRGFCLSTELLGYREEMLICLAGPVLNFIFFALSAALSFFSDFNRYFVFAAASNFSLFLLNILPIYPLDGGRALYCFLCLRSDVKCAAKIIKTVSFIFLLPLGILSAIILVRSGYNFSLVIICVYLTVLLTGVLRI